MRDFAKRAIAAGVGAIVLGCAGAGPAAAADVPLPQGAQQAPPPGYYGEQDYYGNPPPPRGYVYRRPPPVYYAPPLEPYYDGAPAVAVVPTPYYRPYGYVYAPGYLARGYGRYDGPWGYRRW